MRINVPAVGFILGLILPVAGFLLMLTAWSHGSNLSGYMATLMRDHRALAKVLTLGLLINLVPFLYFNIKRPDYALRGVVTATMLYAVLIILVMFVW